MGQYQQWLHFREVDQRLRAELEALETELAQLQDQVNGLEQTFPYPDNQIIRALAISMEREAQPTSTSSSDTIRAESPPDGLPDTHEFSHVLSPSLQHWGALPDFSPQELQESFQNVEVSKSPSTPHSEIILLPEDVIAIFEEHNQTDPQLELPWWLRNIMDSTGTPDRTSPIDQESIRTNRLVQRWLERWGRRPPTQQKSQEDDVDE
jgi:hypothetical protein